ncbi:hypothetical protein ATANTOWER_011908 [Ataeniobius toweri]|uniref:Secreted protein n=1 Tax=Ataeniobius toweri TaxID=208326 RepID=A0ABU7BWS9_9TELE|nr:hypothetical protein [Ataeniobius toweri]
MHSCYLNNDFRDRRRLWGLCMLFLAMSFQSDKLKCEPPFKQGIYSAQLSPNVVNHREAFAGSDSSARFVSLHSICEHELFQFFPLHSSCFAPSCHCSHQKN